MKVSKEELISYESARNYFHYDRAVETAKDENGIVDEEKLNEILDAIYKKIIGNYLGTADKSNPSVNKNIARINELYELVRDREKMQYLEDVSNREKLLNVNREDMIKASSPISKMSYVGNKTPKILSLNIDSEDENEKAETVRIAWLGQLVYRTSFNKSSKIDVYKIQVKDNKSFNVFTNTLFNNASMLMQKRENGEELTDDEKLYIEKVRKQLSYDYLRECQEKLNGYIGTVESQNGSTDIVFDPDDYRVCDTFISRINTNEYNANKEDFEK